MKHFFGRLEEILQGLILLTLFTTATLLLSLCWVIYLGMVIAFNSLS